MSSFPNTSSLLEITYVNISFRKKKLQQTFGYVSQFGCFTLYKKISLLTLPYTYICMTSAVTYFSRSYIWARFQLIIIFLDPFKFSSLFFLSTDVAKTHGNLDDVGKINVEQFSVNFCHDSGDLIMR